MSTLNFPDSNVWLALIHGGHMHSPQAQAWFNEPEVEQIYYCRFTQMATLRLLTTARVMGPDTVGMVEAWRLWDTLMADNRIAMLDEPEGLESDFRAFTRLSSASPKVWSDAYLLAFASTANLRLVTFDRSLGTGRSAVLVL